MYVVTNKGRTGFDSAGIDLIMHRFETPKFQKTIIGEHNSSYSDSFGGSFGYTEVGVPYALAA